ncbi:MAG: hypothetical protein LDLANPLL_02207 [Turneriella sp.]|nr:hypothetical protein [Turneriella sp.]
MRKHFLWVALLLFYCKKATLHIPPCDEDLGYLTRKEHLANTEFLTEHKYTDWFEILDNLDTRRKNVPPYNCIPIDNEKTVEAQINRTEHNLKNLR